MTRRVKEGDRVRVSYVGRLESGDIFDSTEKSGPLTFSVGSEELIRGFDRAVVGMEIGERKRVTVPPEEAYGYHREDLIITMPRESVTEGIGLERGTIVELSDSEGNPTPGRIVEIDGDLILVDINHPLASLPLDFDIEIIGIESVEKR